MSENKMQRAIADILQGKMVIITDDKNRENEGDLVMAAEKVTPEAINFMAHYGRGLICMPMSETYFNRLEIPMMVQHNQSTFQTGFGVSIGAAKGTTTGISAYDRALTIKTAANPQSTARDIVKPGHIFPLKAVKGGVLKRKGHTEASTDLMTMAGLNSAAVICEIMNDDGSMAREKDLETFARAHEITVISIQDIFDYRVQSETLVKQTACAHFPTRYGAMKIHTFESDLDAHEWIAITAGDIKKESTPLVRLHSQCLTGDVFHSLRCDCGEQLQVAMNAIAKAGGILLYLPQEGRGIGLSNKIKSYALQDEGLDTVEANQRLGFEADQREYFIAAQIIKHFGLDSVRLMTNNPRKIEALEKLGVGVVERVPIIISANPDNHFYLKTKQQKLGHLLNDE